MPRYIKHDVILLKEGTEQHQLILFSQCDSTVVSESTLKKIGTEREENQDIAFDGCIIKFKNINRSLAGNYSLAIVLSCHNKSDPRNFNETIEIDVICKFTGVYYGVIKISDIYKYTYNVILCFRWAKHN